MRSRLMLSLSSEPHSHYCDRRQCGESVSPSSLHFIQPCLISHTDSIPTRPRWGPSRCSSQPARRTQEPQFCAANRHFSCCFQSQRCNLNAKAFMLSSFQTHASLISQQSWSVVQIASKNSLKCDPMSA